MSSTILLSDNGVSSGVSGIKTTGGNDGKLLLQTSTAGGTATTAVTIDTSQNVSFAQNVGVGTTSPVSGANLTTLTVYNATQPALYLQNSTTGTTATDGFSIGMSGTDCYVNNRESGNIITYVNGAERTRIDTSGNLLVGGTTSGAIGITLQNQANNSGAPYIQLNKSFSGLTTAIYFHYNSSAVGSITYSNTATAYLTSSDYRLKKDIAPMTGALATVQALKPVTYKWNSDDSVGQGFIAHELQEVVPECVGGAKDAVDENGNPVYQGIDTSFLVATLTAAIQELNAKFEEYKAAHP